MLKCEGEVKVLRPLLGRSPVVGMRTIETGSLAYGGCGGTLNMSTYVVGTFQKPGS